MDLDKDISVYDSPDYHFFWGGHCSQWMISPFEEFGETFNTAEQFMMAAKAKTFGDSRWRVWCRRCPRLLLLVPLSGGRLWEWC